MRVRTNPELIPSTHIPIQKPQMGDRHFVTSPYFYIGFGAQNGGQARRGLLHVKAFEEADLISRRLSLARPKRVRH